MQALSAFPSARLSKPYCRVNNGIELHALSKKLVSKPSRGARIEDLHIVLDTPFPLDALHQCLKHMPNVTDLTLLISEPGVLALLEGVHLPNIQYFHTNVDHHLLPAFLALHTTIVALELAECGDSELPCPLKDISLDQVLSIGGPTKCVSHLAHDALSRLTMEVSDGAWSPSRLLPSVATPLGSLYVLTIDFYPDEYDILENIAAVGSTVRKLKLLEKPCVPIRRKTSRRAWNDGLAWFKALLRLSCLEEFLLRTASPVLRGSRSADIEANERKTFMCWVNGVHSGRQRCPLKPHPVLYHIGVWYRVDDPARSVVTHWSWASGSWRRIALLANPPADYDFI